MKSTMLIFALFLTSTAISAQEAYKCKVGGAMVIQDSPCKVVGPAPGSKPITGADAREPDAPASAAQPQQSKLERDKEYVAERVKARIDEREKDQAATAIANCEAEANSYTQRISAIASSAPTGVPLNQASANALMLDQQNRQTQIASLQAQAAAKRAECDAQRQAFAQRWKK